MAEGPAPAMPDAVRERPWQRPARVVLAGAFLLLANCCLKHHFLRREAAAKASTASARVTKDEDPCVRPLLSRLVLKVAAVGTC